MTVPYPAFFATLSRAGSGAVLTAVAGFAHQRDVDAIDSYIEHATKHGFDELDPAESHHVAVKGGVQMSVVQSVALAMQPPGKPSQWLQSLADASSWSDRHTKMALAFVEALKHHLGPKANAAVITFAHYLAPFASSHELFTALLEQGVIQLPCVRDVDLGTFQSHSLTHRALMTGNVHAATSLVNAMKRESANALADDLVHKEYHHKQGGKASSSLAALVHLGHMETVDRFFCALDKVADPDRASRARWATVSAYLNRCCLVNKAWEGEQVTQLTGNIDTLNFNEPTEDLSFVSAIALQAIVRSHCTPLLEKLREAFPAAFERDGSHWVKHAVQSDSMRLYETDPPHINPMRVHALKETIATLIDATSAAAIGERHDSLLHHLAGNTDRHQRSAALPMLLELGFSTSLKNEKGKVPRMLVAKGPERDHWQMIERSFAAKSNLTDVMLTELIGKSAKL